MNAAKMSERARLQHAVDCVEHLLASAGELGLERLSHMLRDDPRELTSVERETRQGMIYRYVQMAEEAAHMDRRVLDGLAAAGLDVRGLVSHDRNLGAHEADKLNGGDLYDMIVSGDLRDMGDVFSEMLAKLAEEKAFFFPDQLRAEVVKKVGPDASEAVFEAALKARIEEAERELDGLQSVW